MDPDARDDLYGVGLEGTDIVEGCDYLLVPAPPVDTDPSSVERFTLFIYNRNTGEEERISDIVTAVHQLLVTRTGQMAYSEKRDSLRDGFVDVATSVDATASDWDLTDAIIRNAYCDTTSETFSIFTSIGPSTQIDDETGLIKQSTFALDWNRLDDSSEWSNSTKAQYNKFENAELSGTMTLLADVVELNGTATNNSFTMFSALNTGENQQDPTTTFTPNIVESLEWMAGGGKIDVAYGSVEEDAIKDKYKRYATQEYETGLAIIINDLVEDVIARTIKTRSQYNFTKIDTNRPFKERDVTAFVGEGMGTTDTTETAATTDIAVPTTTMGGGYSY